MINIDIRKESKFASKRSILIDNYGLILLLKLLISIQELIRILEQGSFLKLILMPLPVQIAISRLISIQEPIFIPEPNLILDPTPIPK